MITLMLTSYIGWLLLAALFFVGTIAVAFESIMLAVLAAFVILFTANILGIYPVWDWIVHNPDKLLEYAAAYVVVGILWSFAKWSLYVWKQRDLWVAAKLDYMKSSKLTEDLLTASDFNSIKGSSGVRSLPQARSNKHRITCWMIWWPSSMLWTLIDDPIRRLFNFIYRRLSGLFDRISRAIFGTMADDFVKKTEDFTQANPSVIRRRSNGE